MTKRDPIVARVARRISTRRLPRVVAPMMLGGLVAMSCNESLDSSLDPATEHSESALEASGGLTEQAADEAPVYVDGIDNPPVTTLWSIVRAGDAEVITDHIVAEIENSTSDFVSVDLYLVGTGLDQRMAAAPVGHFQLNANEKKYVKIPIEDLPIKSIGVPSQIELVATSSGPNWVDKRVPTDSLFVQFSQDYAEAYVSYGSSWAVTALALAHGDKSSKKYGDLLLDPLSTVRQSGTVGVDALDDEKARQLYDDVLVPWMKPRGVYLDESGEWVEVVGDGSVWGGLPMSAVQTELFSRLFAYADDEGEGGSTRFLGLYNFCMQWRTSFVDSYKGEDYLLGTPLFGGLSPARYAVATVRAGSGFTPFLALPLNADGCTGYLALTPGHHWFTVSNKITAPNRATCYSPDDNGNPYEEWFG
ncbi:MAG: hypothetical protein FWD57_14700, partial [Polyangiaceae bacterium]|nr:hypothetical protein [Polyangiaceae bacterium]